MTQHELDLCTAKADTERELLAEKADNEQKALRGTFLWERRSLEVKVRVTPCEPAVAVTTRAAASAVRVVHTISRQEVGAEASVAVGAGSSCQCHARATPPDWVEGRDLQCMTSRRDTCANGSMWWCTPP